MMDAIVTKGLTKRYRDVVAVNEIDLCVREGELFSLLGVNGAGKTTLLKMLSCLTSSDAGDAWLGGYSICKEQNEVKRILAISPQETAVAPNLTVRENLALIAGIHGFDRPKSHRRIAELTDLFSLSPIIEKRAGKLSGGWQRRLSIAMALMSEPRILFLDEPTLGLDVLARSELWEHIRALKGKVTVILTTHYMEEAEALSDRVGILASGKLLCVGSVDEIKQTAGADRLEEAFVRLVRGGEAI